MSRRSGVSPAPFDEPIYVTRPLLPPLASLTARLEEVWATQQLTNSSQLKSVRRDIARVRTILKEKAEVK